MKPLIKTISIHFVFSFLFIFVFVYPSQAATIYNNSFNGSPFSDFTTTGFCDDSQGYLTATSGTCDLNWNTVINYGCVSMDIYNATGNANLNPLSIGTNFVGANNTDFVGGLNFSSPNSVYLFDNEIGGALHPYPSGISELLSGWHHFDLCEDGSNYNLYYDSYLTISYTPITYAVWNGLNFQVGSGNGLKNLIISTSNIPTSPLNVPLLKQTDPAWASQEYDSGNSWALPGHGTIGNYGCAMTSAAMVLQYYGINKLPDNTDLNPGTLNTWLKNQSDGYVGDGLLNWLALSRLSKLAKSNNPSFTYDGLEFAKTYSADTTQLTNDINNNQPDILEEPGHFIVAKGINGNTFDINDPYYNRTDLTSGYNNTFLTLGRYIPSHTNLSYIMLTVNPNVTLTVKTSSGSAVGTQFIQQPLGDASNNGTPSGKPLKIFYLPKPNTGTYTVTLSGNTQQYQLRSYLYDINAKVVPTIINGTLGTNTPESFTLSFNNQNTNVSSITKLVTFQSFINDVNQNVVLNQVNKQIGNALIPLISSAKDSEDKGQKTAAKLKLDAIEVVLNLFHGKGISDTAYQILYYDGEYLKSHV